MGDVKEETINITDTALQFKGKSESKDYEVNIEFFKPIDAKGSTYNVLTRSVHMQVMKATVEGDDKDEDEEEFWPRLLKDKTLEKNQVKIDWDRYVDEDEEEEGFDQSNLEGGNQMGGMPPGMGGMGGGMPPGMGGMPGMGGGGMPPGMGGMPGMGGGMPGGMPGMGGGEGGMGGMDMEALMKQMGGMGGMPGMEGMGDMMGGMGGEEGGEDSDDDDEADLPDLEEPETK